MFPSVLICLLIIVPALGVLILNKIGFGTNSDENAMLFVLCLPIAIMVIAPLFWLINTLTVKINTYDDRLEIRSVFRKMIVRWTDVAELNKKSYFSGTFPSYGPPKDLEIITANKKRIKVYYFIKSDSGEDDGIEEFELEIRKHLHTE